jgi:diadenylate cyclase
MMINYLLTFFWNTRAMDLVLGMLAFLAMFAVAGWLHLPVLKQLMLYVVNVFVIAVLILFQPEFRMALSKLSMKSRKYRQITEFDTFLETLAQTIFRLSERRIGALIVLENQDNLQEYAQSAVNLNAEFSQELLESIFATTTPLHDGAIILRETTIVAAAAILPLAEDSRQITRSMGTRHRAGLGISQQTDALVVVVSEETGRVSVARDGIMTRGIKIDRFRGIIRSIFNPPKPPSKWRILEWFKR